MSLVQSVKPRLHQSNMLPGNILLVTSYNMLLVLHAALVKSDFGLGESYTVCVRKS